MTWTYNNETKLQYNHIVAVANQQKPEQSSSSCGTYAPRMYRFNIVQLKTNIGKFVRRDLKIYFFRPCVFFYPRLLFLSPEMHDVHNMHVSQMYNKCVRYR